MFYKHEAPIYSRALLLFVCGAHDVAFTKTYLFKLFADRRTIASSFGARLGIIYGSGALPTVMGLL